MQSISAKSVQLDRIFLDLSSKLTEPFCSAYSLLRYRLVMPLDPLQFDHCTTITREIALRSLIVLIAGLSISLFAIYPLPIACGILALGNGSRLFRAIGFAFQKNGFTHIRGNSPEKTVTSQLKLMTWNLCGVPGGFHYDHGGVIHWRGRFDRIIEKIKQEDPDVLVLQEIYDTALAEALVRKLQDTYAHFFVHLGATIFGCVGGCMVLSKCGVHRFSNIDFRTNDWTLKRGFSSLEIKQTPKASIPFARIIGTHLIHQNEPEKQRARILQISQMFAHLASQTPSLPTFLLGDLNIERDATEGELLSRYVRHAYTNKEPTCTNRLVHQWSRKAQSVWNETIDFISLFKEKKSWPVKEKGVAVVDCHLSKSFDQDFNTRTALSDHHAVVATLKVC